MSEIDVSKCEHYCCGKCYNDYLDSVYCEDNNCNYKQLQQLKSENEKLKQERDLYKTWYRAKHDDLKNFLGQLKAENESYEYQLQKRIEICDIWFGVANKYKQCLDEIEEIARTLGNQNDVKYRLDDSGIQDLFKIEDDLLSSEEIMRKHILQLIKQVKEGE